MRSLPAPAARPATAHIPGGRYGGMVGSGLSVTERLVNPATHDPGRVILSHAPAVRECSGRHVRLDQTRLTVDLTTTIPLGLASRLQVRLAFLGYTSLPR